MCSGVLLLIDAGLTLAWQEPVSAFLASREQAQLNDELEGLRDEAEADQRAVADEGDVRKRLARLARLQARRTDTAQPQGKLQMPSLGRSYVVVEGTDLGTLRKGPGHYPKTPLPGEGGTVAVAGHRTTYGAPFRTINDLERGDELTMEMPYGRFEYRVERTQIVKPDALWITRKRGYEQLVLSACHPLYSAARRIIVFARLKRADPR